MQESKIAAAFEYAFPLFEMARTRYRALEDEVNAQRHAPNTVRHERHLSDHTSRWITAPNNDTLYSNAWLDLSSGPVQIRLDKMPAGRYWSLAFMDVFTNHFAIVGQRLEGAGPVDLRVSGPDEQEPICGGREVRAPGRDAWLFIRCLVDGQDDLPNAHAMQERIDIVAPPDAIYGARVVPTSSRDPRNFLAVANELLGRNPPPEGERALLAEWADIGLRPGDTEAWERLGDATRELWKASIGPLHDKLRQASASGRREIQGWFASAKDMGDFGQNYPLRASVALGGLGALPPVEAMYFVRFHDDEKQLLDGRQRYVLRIPPTGIPTDSFWSFSMYEPTADSQRFFVENTIRRYSIGNRTHGIVWNEDGSMDIPMQRDEPSDPRLRANWLPTPDGPFQISLRTYMPRDELREGSAAMPRIDRR
ncbi:DUF1254 domain-containing protein [Ottowia thiooxydans]|uniref:DUF1254 domain-containing protein n=1 Tax=Ottowia thiooxydans TaxID=219182 RepID=UPI00040F2D2A|nr:DUF1254 domain-containing protein [Ottowia thiooxydans]